MERPRYKLLWRRKRKRFVCRWWDAEEEKWRDETLSPKLTRRRDAETAATDFLDRKAAEVEGVDPLTWAGFRAKYEEEKASALDSYAVWKCAAKKLELYINPEWLADINPAAISRLESKMRAADLSEASIETYLKYVRAALNWAAEIELIEKAPRVRIPKRSAGTKRSRGRAVTGEELDRWLEKLEHEVGKDRYPSWERLLRGLNLSGLRLGESLNFWWDSFDMITVLNLEGRHPVWQFPARLHKARVETTCPMTPDFAEFLRAIPKAERVGPVFSPLGKTRPVQAPDYVGRTISAAGKAAKIVVSRQGSKVTHATAHDLRRTFGDRWAPRVMPIVLKELMRHASIQTTMTFYVGRSAEQTSELVQQAVAAMGGKKGGNLPPADRPRKSSKPKNTEFSKIKRSRADRI